MLFKGKSVSQVCYYFALLRCYDAVPVLAIASRGIKYWLLDNLCGCYWHLFLLCGVPGFISIW